MVSVKVPHWLTKIFLPSQRMGKIKFNWTVIKHFLADCKCNELADCIPTPSGGKCKCKSGYVGNGLLYGSQCIDLDECELGLDRLCHLNADCTNTQGSYECTCQEGYIGDGEDCWISDFCRLAPNPICHDHAVCENEETENTCICKEGYDGDGLICEIKMNVKMALTIVILMLFVSTRQVHSAVSVI